MIFSQKYLHMFFNSYEHINQSYNYLFFNLLYMIIQKL